MKGNTEAITKIHVFPETVFCCSYFWRFWIVVQLCCLIFILAAPPPFKTVLSQSVSHFSALRHVLSHCIILYCVRVEVVLKRNQAALLGFSRNFSDQNKRSSTASASINRQKNRLQLIRGPSTKMLTRYNLNATVTRINRLLFWAVQVLSANYSECNIWTLIPSGVFLKVYQWVIPLAFLGGPNRLYWNQMLHLAAKKITECMSVKTTNRWQHLLTVLLPPLCAQGFPGFPVFKNI